MPNETPPKSETSQHPTYLNEFWIESAGPQALFDGTDKPQGGPDDMFGTFQYDGVTGEQSGDDW